MGTNDMYTGNDEEYSVQYSNDYTQEMMVNDDI